MQNLPVELIAETTRYLECSDLVRFGETCKDMQDLVDGDFLWKEKLAVDFPSEGISSKNYKKLYISQYKAQQNWIAGAYHTNKIADSHSTRMRTVLFQENLVFYAQEDYQIIIHNVDTLESIRLPQEHEPVCMYFHKNKLWVADLAAKITVWDLKTQTCVKLPQVLPYPSRFIIALDSLPYVVTASWSNLELCVWKEDDEGAWKCITTLTGHSQAISCINTRGNLVVTGSGDGTCRVWDMETLSCCQVLQGCGGFVTCVAFTDDRVVCGTRNNRLVAWNTTTGQILYQMNDAHRGEVLKLSVLRDNSIFSCGMDGMVTSRNAEALDRVKQEKGAFGMFDLTRNQKLVAACSYSDGAVSIGKLNKDKKIEVVYTIPSLESGFKPYYVKIVNNRALLASDCGSIFLLDFNNDKM